ncbi:hypothetical protein J6590_013661 [Homalodisca vitripennis]|nr:hypothetical protein J6590_013661 [Homalodisca vitripennis]
MPQNISDRRSSRPNSRSIIIFTQSAQTQQITINDNDHKRHPRRLRVMPTPSSQNFTCSKEPVSKDCPRSCRGMPVNSKLVSKRSREVLSNTERFF